MSKTTVRPPASLLARHLITPALIVALAGSGLLAPARAWAAEAAVAGDASASASERVGKPQADLEQAKVDEALALKRLNDAQDELDCAKQEQNSAREALSGPQLRLSWANDALAGEFDRQCASAQRTLNEVARAQQDVSDASATEQQCQEEYSRCEDSYNEAARNEQAAMNALNDVAVAAGMPFDEYRDRYPNDTAVLEYQDASQEKLSCRSRLTSARAALEAATEAREEKERDLASVKPLGDEAAAKLAKLQAIDFAAASAAGHDENADSTLNALFAAAKDAADALDAAERRADAADEDVVQATNRLDDATRAYAQAQERTLALTQELADAQAQEEREREAQKNAPDPKPAKGDSDPGASQPAAALPQTGESSGPSPEAFIVGGAAFVASGVWLDSRRRTNRSL